MKCLFFLIIIVSSVTNANSQRPPKGKEINNLQFGLKAGIACSNITNLSNVLVSETYYTGYTFKNKKIYGFTGGIYINYRFEETISAIYSEISYSRTGNTLHYSDIYNFTYDFSLKYDYVNWELVYKAYPFKGLYFGVGPRIGFNLNPGGLYYSSNGEDQFGPDIRIQQQMRDVLKGRTNVSLGLSAGYEFSFGISLDIRLYYGVSDVLETEVNNFHFIENKNESRTFQLTIGYAIPYEP